jgi:hypothetical protein
MLKTDTKPPIVIRGGKVVPWLGSNGVIIHLPPEWQGKICEHDEQVQKWRSRVYQYLFDEGFLEKQKT